MIRILINGHHATILENTAELLDLEGYETTSNGKDRLEKVNRLVPDVILCDLRMPKMDCFTVLKRMGGTS